jgi:toxin YoeB
MRRLTFEPKAFDEFLEWSSKDEQIFQRTARLLHECLRHPFNGAGKPEPLKHDFKGFWPRRITVEHPLVYKVTDDK